MQIYGASGHAKVIIECLEANNQDIDNIFDNDSSISNIFNYQVNKSRLNEIDETLIAIGNNLIRKKIVESNNFIYGNTIHPSAQISKRATIDKGTVVFQKAVIQAETSIGKHTIINTAATVDHECIIGDFVHIAPGATICGNVKIGNLSLIGAGVTILPNLIIGENCVIGAGSVVLKNIPNNSIVLGNPAKLKK
jgi:sugar O-acyltransferase (sialic acid O-acetyltransferase NeuD family)